MSDARREEIDRLIRDEWPKLRRFLRTKVPDSEIDDVAQQVILGFIEGRARATSGEKAYFWGVARLQVLKHYEKHRRSTPFDSSMHTAMDVGPSLSSRLDNRNRLVAALHQLPVDHQTAFELRHGEELSLEETADAIGVSLATVKRYLASAEERLRAILSVELESTSRAYRAL